MFSISEFASLEDLNIGKEVPNLSVRYGEKLISPISMKFKYDTNFDPRFEGRFENKDYPVSLEAEFVSLDGGGIDGSFFQVSSTFGLSSEWSAVFSPLQEPFRWGQDENINLAEFVVLNGPNLFFKGRSLIWVCDGLKFEYSLFDGAVDLLKKPKLSEKKIIPTGTLRINQVDGNLFQAKIARNAAYEGSRLLTFLNGTGVSVGHGVLFKDGDISSWYVGFIRCDPLNTHSNWFEIENFSDAQNYAECYSRYITNEHSSSPLLYATDFYRASNTIRDSSQEMAVIASYSALEVLVSHILREEAGWSAGLLGSRVSMADRLRACAHFCGISDKPLSKAERVNKKLKSYSGMDDYDVLAETRNSIVHSDKKFKLEGFELHEVWLASQWLVEVFVFYLIGYRGTMNDRRPMKGWRGEYNGKVPIL